MSTSPPTPKPPVHHPVVVAARLVTALRELADAHQRTLSVVTTAADLRVGTVTPKCPECPHKDTWVACPC